MNAIATSSIPRAVQRKHGFGNVLNLVSVLNGTAAGQAWVLVTRREWLDVLRPLAPGVSVVTEWPGPVLDLDAVTRDMVPRSHRTEEFADILGLQSIIPQRPTIPQAWYDSSTVPASDLLLALEAGHAARRWPMRHAARLVAMLGADRFTLVGTEAGDDLPGTIDRRGRTTLPQLFALIAGARAVVTLDSGVLHIAQWTGTPTVALFGPVDPRYRVSPDDRVWALHAALECNPCNKIETCAGRHDCMRQLSPEAVVQALATVDQIGGRYIQQVALQSESESIIGAMEAAHA